MMKMMNKINAMMAKTSIIMKVLLIILNGLYITNINIQKQMKKFFPLKVWYNKMLDTVVKNIILLTDPVFLCLIMNISDWF